MLSLIPIIVMHHNSRHVISIIVVKDCLISLPIYSTQSLYLCTQFLQPQIYSFELYSFANQIYRGIYLVCSVYNNQTSITYNVYKIKYNVALLPIAIAFAIIFGLSKSGFKRPIHASCILKTIFILRVLMSLRTCVTGDEKSFRV